MKMATRVKGRGLAPLLKIKKMQLKRAIATETMLYYDRTKDSYFNGRG